MEMNWRAIWRIEIMVIYTIYKIRSIFLTSNSLETYSILDDRKGSDQNWIGQLEIKIDVGQ